MAATVQFSQIPFAVNSKAIYCRLTDCKRLTIGQHGDLTLASCECHARGMSRPQTGFHKALLTTRETVNLSNFPDPSDF